ncbi:CPBP family intramembrane metalloprotease [Halorubrum sp. JWXQ-INN 858]|uniref:CPBP family intramembrane glutamic endopeptidase n=1 Tax=Halorubrum sp. JWXQ-INN 858 TaxID=2690782 RepID=UPI00135A1FC7|nr:CPBP family intramembrane glutamic endopeptidase [Halorubrum sp. JWXQ-INN 858]MWV65394.1 CPBP family intramembrane metalloprotease [Halorubrum sp. JWXQ-INN 858]
MRARNPTRGWRSTFRGAAALFALGVAGVVAVAVYSVPALREVPELALLSYPALVLIAAVNPALFLVPAVVIGAVTAPRIGLQSHVFAWGSEKEVDWRAFRASIPLAAATGALLFGVVAVLDAVFAPVTGLPAGDAATGAEAMRELVASIPMRLLYGGITEEVLLRWGVMAPVAFVLWWGRRKLGGGGDGVGERGAIGETPSAPVMWAAIVVSAVVFGIGHLPALAAVVEVTAAVAVRTVLLNAIVGIALGWLFWRRSLETAMVAHAAFHVALVAVSAVLIWAV